MSAYHVTLCKDIEPTQIKDQEKTFDRDKSQTDFATFADWAQREANALCQGGGCAEGKCRGHVDVTDWQVTAESDDSFTCRFTVELFCRCG